MAIEDQLFKQNGPSDLPNSNFAASTPAAVPGVYQRGVPVHSQPLFTTAILTALKQVNYYFIKLLNRESIYIASFSRNRLAGCIRNSLGY